MSIKLDILMNHPQYVEEIALWYWNHWGIKYPTRTLSDWKEQLYLSTSIPITLVAIDISNLGSRIVGTVSLHYKGLSNYPADSVWLTALFVNPSDRHQGIGTALIDFACEYAKKLNVKELNLFTYTNGEIYFKKGWAVSSEDKGCLIMQKKIMLPVLESSQQGSGNLTLFRQSKEEIGIENTSSYSH